ncbi:N-acetylneuraminate synthase [Legionella sp. km772]|uniref:N-acetylneuraminate synthase n=1 Tax=Legionella sp. km772 TaxID=2498111 RepID=UPI000F8DACC9|nr:N-acetylneuraminate synthase [Legionella sp. km772]RUR12119.1 N-acetylneuraminate synthase [Legionella sp. km772]
MGCFIIAEAGVNHNGDVALAKELVHVAKEIGADAIKFQTFNAEKLVNKTAEKAHYQKTNTGNFESTQYEMLKSLELSIDDHYLLNDLAQSIGIEFMSTGFDEESVNFLVDLGIKRIKIPSGEITNYPYLEHVAATGLPLIMSTGMCDLNEVKNAVNIIRPYYSENLGEYLTLLHCTSNYPAAFSDVNLKAMQTLAQEFNLPVGYSDHTLGSLVSTLAVGLGAVVIEKHFTLDKNLPGPDHAASMVPEEMKFLIQSIKDTEVILGKSEKKPAENELAVRDLVRRSVTIKYDLPSGSTLNQDDLILLRPGHGISPGDMPKILGRKLVSDLKAGTTLLWEHLAG